MTTPLCTCPGNRVADDCQKHNLSGGVESRHAAAPRNPERAVLSRSSDLPAQTFSADLRPGYGFTP